MYSSLCSLKCTIVKGSGQVGCKLEGSHVALVKAKRALALSKFVFGSWSLSKGECEALLVPLETYDVRVPP